MNSLSSILKILVKNVKRLSSSTMTMSSSEVKHALRKTDFPFCAREALGRIEQIYAPNTMGRPPSTKQIEFGCELMAEFVFCEADRRGSRKRRLTCIQELQLLEVLCDYFTYSGEPVRNAVFMALFPAVNAERCRLLAKLVSMAISTKNTPVLNATGVWMQHLGSATHGSVELAQGLVKDYFVLVPRAGSGLQNLPQLAPHFTTSFLTAVAEIYTGDGLSSAPPQQLLEVVTQWVADLPTLCIAALPLETSHGTSPTTPYAGLFRWCVLAPLHAHPSVEVLLYSRLHLALLESLIECRRLQPERLEGSILPHQWMATAKIIIRSNATTEAIQESIDRFAQALQLMLDFRLLALSGRQELFIVLDSLPPNRLLTLILRKHRGQS